MNNLYIDCSMGAAGDMLLSALTELMNNKEKFVSELNALNIPTVTYTLTSVKKQGIMGSHITISIDGEVEGEHHHEYHHHSGIGDINNIITSLPLPQKVKEDAMAVYNLIAQAESTVHGEKIENIHFHEVGTMDAVADVVGVCYAMYKLQPDTVYASPVHVGSGSVKCAHGVLPVPAPATALLLSGIPIYSENIKGELCTPTGAALLKHFVTEFCSMPLMTVKKIGYGMGSKDFERANCVRIIMGDKENDDRDVISLSCNIDDMTGEEIGYATEVLLKEGALDVYTTPIYMKKGRPGILLTLLCKKAETDRFTRLIFKHTTTIGIRENAFKRHILSRDEVLCDTEYGKVRKKVSLGYGVRREKYEYEDLKSIADERGESIIDIKNKLKD